MWKLGNAGDIVPNPLLLEVSVNVPHALRKFIGTEVREERWALVQTSFAGIAASLILRKPALDPTFRRASWRV
jgi:hypothetical protein